MHTPTPPTDHRAGDRDPRTRRARADGRARRVTRAVALGAVALTAVLGLIVAKEVPGHASSGTVVTPGTGATTTPDTSSHGTSSSAPATSSATTPGTTATTTPFTTTPSTTYRSPTVVSGGTSS